MWYSVRMSFLEAIVLGITQGLTEFIPVSSSGHLILVHKFFGSSTNDLALDAVLQLATVLAVLVYFRLELWTLIKNTISIVLRKPVEQKDKTLVGALFFGTIPAIILGLLLESKIETAFRSIHLVAYGLLAGSILMFIADRMVKASTPLTTKKGVIIGFFQSLALVPGVSRSGATISGGLLQGLSREEATRFSFLLSFPIIFGSGLKKLLDLFNTAGGITGPQLVACAVAFIVGLFCIHYLLKYLKTHSLSIFIWYRVVLAMIILLLL